jgi:glycosyltransferase involved in cell wall biosynthesis
MRLLILTNNPERASFRQRIGAYLDVLGGHGIRPEVAVLPAGFLARRRLFGRARDFDGVLLHKKTLTTYDMQCLRRHSRRLIYNFDDAVMFSDKHPDAYSRTHAWRFRRTVRRADLVIVGSGYLADLARPFNARVEVLPLGLNIRDYSVGPHPASDVKVRLVWIGSASTLGYLEMIKPAIERIVARFDDAVLRIICDTFPSWPDLPVEQTVWSRESRRTGLASGDIGLAPLPDNPFTRGKCSFKVLEYSASGLPVIASPVGTNAEYVRDGVTGFLATTMDQWVDKIGQLIENPSQRRSLGHAGIERAREFDVSIVGERLCKLIATCLREDG